MIPPAITVDNVSKRFRLHLRGGLELPVVDRVSFTVAPGEAVVLGGPSGSGKSSVLKMIYGSYRCGRGRILVEAEDGPVDVARAEPRAILKLRRTTMAYVSQFLRVIPRVSTLEIVAEPLIAAGTARRDAEAQAAILLERLNLPSRLWTLPPATFSGGEQQRVNIVRGFAVPRPILLLDEPTASLDGANRRVVAELIGERKRDGTAILGIFHDTDVRDAVADRVVDITAFSTRTAEAA